LKNKKYTLFIATDQSSSSRSLQISKYGLVFLLLFEIMAVTLGIYGFMVLFNIEDRSYELNSLRKYSYYLTEVLNNSEFRNLKSDSIIYNNALVKQIGSKKQIDYYNSLLDNYSTNSNNYEPIDDFINHLELFQDSIPNSIPRHGFVTNSINFDDKHFGIDISTTMGNDIYSAGRGMVVSSSFNSNLGNNIIISHANGFFTVYGHNDTNLVDVRELVEAGQVIAKVGTTGVTTGPHLHFEMWQNNKLLDPTELIKYYKDNKIF